jgi:hypothetical protein
VEEVNEMIKELFFNNLRDKIPTNAQKLCQDPP